MGWLDQVPSNRSFILVSALSEFGSTIFFGPRSSPIIASIRAQCLASWNRGAWPGKPTSIEHFMCAVSLGLIALELVVGCDGGGVEGGGVSVGHAIVTAFVHVERGGQLAVYKSFTFPKLEHVS